MSELLLKTTELVKLTQNDQPRKFDKQPYFALRFLVTKTKYF